MEAKNGHFVNFVQKKEHAANQSQKHRVKPFFLHAKKWFFLVFERPLGGKFVKDFELAQSND